MESLKNELIQFQSNDPLVNILAKPHLWEEIDIDNLEKPAIVPFNGNWIKHYKRFSEVYKETGIQTACFVSKTISWKYKEDLIETPLFLIPLAVSRLKNTDELQFGFLAEEIFVNPFVEKTFKEQFDLQITIENYEEIINNPRVVSINERAIIGQFHYYRFLFLKEIEEVEQAEKNDVLKQLFGEQYNQPLQKELTSQNLLPYDPTQASVLSQTGKESFIIQGPPGTGKSQVLINIIGKLLLTDGFYAVVSEKKAALDVLAKKLNNLSLSNYNVTLDDQVHIREIYQQFQQTWLDLESFHEAPKTTISVRYFKKQQLQLILDRLQTEKLSSGVSYWELAELKKTVSQNIEPDTFYSISISDWRMYQSHIRAIQEFPFELWSVFPQKFWKKESVQRFLIWSEHYEEFAKQFCIQTQTDLIQLAQWCLIQQLQDVQNYSELIQVVQHKTKLKEVSKLKKRYFKLKLKLSELKNKTCAWNEIPSLEQIQLWKQRSQRLFGKRKIQSVIDATVGVGLSLEMIAPIIEELAAIQSEMSECQQALIEFHIFHPEQDFIELELLQKRYLSIEESSWKTYKDLTIAQKDFLSKRQKDLMGFVHFSDIQPTKKIDFQVLISLFKKHLIFLEKQLPLLSEIPANLYHWMRLKDNWLEVEQQIIANEWRKFEQLFPELATKTLEDIRGLIQEIIQLEKEDEAEFVREIKRHRKQLFDAYHQLLLAKTTKLSDEEKELRVRLKRGKSILVKEMTKTKQHLSLRDLLQSDAKYWIQCLCPVWMMTPTQVAKHFPMESNSFQLTLIDEASQIPASHIVGTMQRSQQVIIAGDSQQMAPSSFFQAEAKLDILSWAQYYFKNYHLRYHYRSKHPALIQFSNRYFYDDELTVFPMQGNSSNPIEWVYVENGKYIQNQNTIEAQIVAKQITKYLRQSQTLGVVAFSQTQLQAIWDALDAESKQILEQRIDEETAFFRPLDKVQGDECDVLIVGFGYGKDEENLFKLHLGPILKQGGEKRLNVLFSRAKEQLIFVSSITANDFPISENEVVQLLKNFFISLTKETTVDELKSPNLEEWLKTIPDVAELIAKFRIYQERGWLV